MSTATVNKVYRITGSCKMTWGNNETITLARDLAVVADGGFLWNNSFKVKSSVAGVPHKVSWIVPSDAVTVGSPCGTADNGLHDMQATNANSSTSDITVFFYTPCNISMNNAVSGGGQIYAGRVKINNAFTLNYVPADVPGVGERVDDALHRRHQLQARDDPLLRVHSRAGRVASPPARWRRLGPENRPNDLRRERPPAAAEWRGDSGSGIRRGGSMAGVTRPLRRSALAALGAFVVLGGALAAPASALPNTSSPKLQLNRTIKTNPFTGTSTKMKDGEGSAYVPADDSLWLAEDVGNQAYEVNRATGALKRVITTSRVRRRAPARRRRHGRHEPGQGPRVHGL